MKCPPGMLSEPGREPSRWWNEACVNRDGGTGVYVLRLESNDSHNKVGLSMEPGKRQAIPMIAIGCADSLWDGFDSIFWESKSMCVHSRAKVLGMGDNFVTVFWDGTGRNLRKE